MSGVIETDGVKGRREGDKREVRKGIELEGRRNNGKKVEVANRGKIGKRVNGTKW
jgi:hypothetical protein